MSNKHHHPVPLSVSEAARLFGLSEKTIRRAIKQRELPVMLIKGRYRMHFESVLEWSQQRPRLRYARDTKGIGQYIAVWDLDTKHAESTDALSHKKGQLSLLD